MKRYVTKLISFLLVAVLLIGLLPATVFAEGKEAIASAAATITLPTAGAHPVDAGTAGDSSYTVRSVHFYDDEDNKLGSSDTFEAGATYQIIVKFRPASGYEIKPTANATINGLPATYWSSIADGWGSKNFYIEYTVPQPEYIDSVSATITLPTAGAHPVETGTPGDSLYTIAWVNFYDSDSHKLDASDTFKAGETYNVYVAFLPNSAYTIESTTAATINGINAKYHTSIGSGTNRKFIFRIDKYTVPRDPVLALNIQGITAPIAGETANTSGITVNNGQGITVATAQWCTLLGRQLWPMSATATFTGGMTYYLVIRYALAEGYTVSDSTVVLHDLPGGEAGHNAAAQTITVACKVPYKITVTTDGGGTASASHTAAAEGTAVTLTATPDPGYEFVKWSVTTPRDLRVFGNNFIMPAANVTIQAVFRTTGGVPGDMDGDGDKDTDDAVYLLLHVMFGDTDYPIANPDKDLNNDSKVDTDDAVYLLLHVMFGAEDYPI